MNQSDIDKLLALRSAWDKFKAVNVKSKKDFDGFYQVFWSYGIERRDEIMRLNDDMCFQLLKEYRTVGGKCDKCNGYKGKPPCVAAFGDASCYSGQAWDIDDNLAYLYMLKRLRYTNKALGIKSGAEADDIADAAAQDIRVTEQYAAVELDTQESKVGLADYKVIDTAQREAELYGRKTGRLHLFCPVGHGWYNKYELIRLSDIFDYLWEP